MIIDEDESVFGLLENLCCVAYYQRDSWGLVTYFKIMHLCEHFLLAYPFNKTCLIFQAAVTDAYDSVPPPSRPSRGKSHNTYTLIGIYFIMFA